MERIETTVLVSLTNVSRDEQQELREYLEANCWKWREIDHEEEKKIGF